MAETTADGIHNVWKETVKGLKAGYLLTKRAFKKPSATGHNGTEERAMTQSERRRMFQAKYAPADHALAEADDSSVDESSSDDDEILTDERIKGLVELKYFDVHYDAAAAEVSQFPVPAPTSEEAIHAECAGVEERIALLRQKCDIVSSTLKKRVLANHKLFVSGIEQMRGLHESLLQASQDCRQTKAVTVSARAATEGQLRILCQKRAVENLKSTARLLKAMKELLWKQRQLKALLSSGKIAEAKRFLEDNRSVDLEESLSEVACMQGVLKEWERYVTEPTAVTSHVDIVLTSCFTHSFIAQNYMSVVESAFQFSPADCFAKVESVLRMTPDKIFRRAYVDLSSVKSDSATMVDVVRGIEPKHLPLAVNSMAAKLTDFLYVFITICDLHRRGAAAAAVGGAEEGTEQPPDGSACHEQVLKRLETLAPQLADHLLSQLTSATLAQSFREDVRVDLILHTFVLIDLTVEAVTVALNAREETVTRCRHGIRGHLCTTLQRYVRAQQANAIVEAMNADVWEISDRSVGSLAVLTSLHSNYFEVMKLSVRRFLQPDEDGAGAQQENPFNTLLLMSPQDVSSAVESVTFTQHWSTQAEVEGESSTEHGKDGGIVAMPTIISQSGLAVFQNLLTVQLSVVTRYPSLAKEAVAWCEQWVCLYLFTVVDNFVSISRSVPVEEQGDFSLDGQHTLRFVRTTAESALELPGGGDAGGGASGDAQRHFPPRVIDAIRSLFVKESQQYALSCRAVACESARAVICLYDCVVQSFAAILGDDDLIAYYRRRAKAMRDVAAEALHVCMHRLSDALLPLPKVCDEIERLRVRKDEVEVSGYVGDMIKGLQQFHQNRVQMPTPDLEGLLIQRSIFAVQSLTLREYGKISKKMNDMLAMQLQVDAQNFYQRAAAEFGSSSLVLPRHTLNLVKSGFSLEDRTQNAAWLEREHASYNAADLLNWFSRGDRVYRSELEVKVKRELKHVDCLPMKKFLHAPC